VKFKIFIVLIFGVGFALNGCTATYNVKKILRTPENLQTYRECQRTVATATGYDEEGYKKIFNNCLKTIELTTEEVTMETNSTYPITGCEEIERIDYEIYYFCK